LALGDEELLGAGESRHLLPLRGRLQTARSWPDVSKREDRVDELEAKTLYGIIEGRVVECCVDPCVDACDTAGVEAKGDHEILG
jgi:hypothetical protein